MKLEKRAKTWKKVVMQSAFGTFSFLRQIIASLLLSVFVCLGLLPTGFMPSFGRGDGAIILCSGLEQKTIPADDQGNPAHKAEIPCAFTLNATAAPTIQPTVLPAPVYEVASYNLSYQSVSRTVLRGPNLSRAPPIA